MDDLNLLISMFWTVLTMFATAASYIISGSALVAAWMIIIITLALAGLVVYRIREKPGTIEREF